MVNPCRLTNSTKTSATSNSISRSINLSLLSLWSILSFGAISSHSALASSEAIEITVDICDQINAAIAGAPAQGTLVIYLPAGDLECSGPVVIDRSNTKIVGKGRLREAYPLEPHTRLMLKPGIAAPLLVIGSMGVKLVNDPVHSYQYYPQVQVNNVTVMNLTVDGSRDKNLPKLDQKCMLEENLDHPDCEQMKRECYDLENKQSVACLNDGGKYIRANAITIRRSSGVYLENVAAARGNSGGLTIEKLSSHIYLQSFWAYDNALDGLAGYQTNNSVFRNLNLSNNVMSGISIDFDFTQNTFDGLVLSGNGDNGVFSHSLSDNVFKNVRVQNNGNFGFYIDGIRHRIDKSDGSTEFVMIQNTCNRNRFENVVAQGNKGAALRLNHLCHDTQLINFRCVGLSKEDPLCINLWPDVRVLYK